MNVKEYIQSWADSYKKDLTESMDGTVRTEVSTLV